METSEGIRRVCTVLIYVAYDILSSGKVNGFVDNSAMKGCFKC